MPNSKAASTDDEFLNWFQSLSVDAQRKVLQIAEKIERESLVKITAAELFSDSPFHISSPINSPFILN